MYHHVPHHPLLTDLYQLTMAQAYFDHGRHETDAVFQMSLRKNPFAGNYTIVAGMDDALGFIKNYHFDDDSLEFLRSIRQSDKPLFHERFLTLLKTSRPNLDVWGVENGEVIFPHEPILRVRGPLIFCQLLETSLLNIINFQSLIATKAARMVKAANDKPIMDFGLRRAQGLEAGIMASKAAFLGGITATSNLYAAHAFNIPTAGTLAHSFVMSYTQELDAFRDFAQSYPQHCTLLVDTYDPQEGIRNAIRTLSNLKTANIGIRLDSGDLLSLSKMARNMLNQAGLNQAKILVSGDLDEYEIARLEHALAPIDGYGVGTKLVTAFQEPALGGIYKLVSIKDNNHQWRDTYKISASAFKRTHPGAKTILRYQKQNSFSFDHVFNAAIPAPKIQFPTDYDQVKSLHHHFMMNGVLHEEPYKLNQAREYLRTNMKCLPNFMSSSYEPYPVFFDNNEASL